MIYAMILWVAMMFDPYWVIMKDGQYLANAGGDVTSSLSMALHFSSQGDAQAAMANAQRHNPKATFAIQAVTQ